MRVVLVGGGNVGTYIARELHASGHEVLIVEADPNRVTEALANGDKRADLHAARGLAVDWPPGSRNHCNGFRWALSWSKERSQTHDAKARCRCRPRPRSRRYCLRPTWPR